MTTSHTHACESKTCPWQVAQFVILHVCILGICGVLLGALAVQFFGGEFPCPLCLLQRMAMILTLIGPVFIIVNAHRERMGGFSVWGLGFGMSIVAAVAGMAISTRQVLLHIAPGDPGYGDPVFGMHLYTWALVVFIVVKNAPRCTQRKCDTYLVKLSLSATIVNPDCCIRSSPVGDERFPVAIRYSTFLPISACPSNLFLKYV